MRRGWSRGPRSSGRCGRASRPGEPVAIRAHRPAAPLGRRPGLATKRYLVATGAAGIARDTAAGAAGTARATRAQPQLEAAAAHPVRARGVLREERRVAERHRAHERADPHALGDRGERAEQGPALVGDELRVHEMVGEVDPFEAERLDPPPARGQVGQAGRAAGHEPTRRGARLRRRHRAMRATALEVLEQPRTTAAGVPAPAPNAVRSTATRSSSRRSATVAASPDGPVMFGRREGAGGQAAGDAGMPFSRSRRHRDARGRRHHARTSGCAAMPHAGAVITRRYTRPVGHSFHRLHERAGKTPKPRRHPVIAKVLKPSRHRRWASSRRRAVVRAVVTMSP